MSDQAKDVSRELLLHFSDAQWSSLIATSENDPAAWCEARIKHIISSQTNKNQKRSSSASPKNESRAASSKHDWEVSADPQEFAAAIDTEKDRGCVLLAASYIAKALASLLRAKLKSMSGEDDRRLASLLKGGPNFPLGSFSARAKLTRAMGLIAESTYRGLIELATLRNNFAHDTGPAEINDARVQDVLRAFSKDSQKSFTLLGSAKALVEHSGAADSTNVPRAVFIFAATILYASIRYAEEKVLRDSKPATD